MLNRHRAIHLAALATAIACLGLAVTTASASSPTSSPVGDTPLLMRGTLALGNVAPSRTLRLTVVLAPRDPAALAAFATAVSTPGSPEYHRYLTTRQFAKRFGASGRRIAALRSTLRQGGLHPGALAPDALSIGVSGSAAQISRAFSVTLRRYREPGGASVFANTAPARVPAGLRGVITDVLGLSNVPVASPTSVPRGRRMSSVMPQLCPGGSPSGPYTISQIASAYGMNVLQTQEANAGAGAGAGVTIALYELEPYANQLSDWNGYTSCAGSSSTNIVDVEVDGGPPPATPQNPSSAETGLDLDVVAGLAPASHIKIYQGPNTGSGPYDTLRAIVNDSSVSVVSDSWGLCELDTNADDPTLMGDENTLLQQAAVEHQSWLVAAGDTGSYGCNATSNSPNLNHYSVDDPASQPFATAVGGTSLDTTASPRETVWNSSGKRNGRRCFGDLGDADLPEHLGHDDRSAERVLERHAVRRSVGPPLPRGSRRLSRCGPQSGLLDLLRRLGRIRRHERRRAALGRADRAGRRQQRRHLLAVQPARLPQPEPLRDRGGREPRVGVQ